MTTYLSYFDFLLPVHKLHQLVYEEKDKEDGIKDYKEVIRSQLH
jgi:hypothetical protein